MDLIKQTSRVFPHGAEHDYADAVSHYTSNKRRDSVKRDWEEPFSVEIYRTAIASLGSPGNLSVLDVGCGTGDGWSLISRAFEMIQGKDAASVMSYVGIDNSPEMLAQARMLHSSSSSMTFQEQDIRCGVPDDAFDIYLSCGVPYSHLSLAEMERAMTHILSAIRRNKARSAIIVDVLGRYSIEWPAMWGRIRWPYRMSFFLTDAPANPVDMSVYSAGSLSRLLDRCSAESGVSLESKRFYDRSIAVGRHTSTREYNKSIAPIRSHINALYSQESIDLAALHLPAVPTTGCVGTNTFHRAFRSAWNENVSAASELLRGTSIAQVLDQIGHTPLVLRDQSFMSGQDADERAVLPALADTLRRLEWTMQPGLGVGHSLIAVVVADGRSQQ
jgi:SAM-dependent methyltransferase